MNVERSSIIVAGDTTAECGRVNQGAAWKCRDSEADRALAAARARLAATNRLYQRRKGISNGPYYGGSGHREEIITSADVPDAVVTRNHYGSLVLNAARTLFIDVDMVETSRMSRLFQTISHRRQDPWQAVLDDLRTVLASEFDEGFRIYRTAAGFRILATSHRFEPGSWQSERLMNSVGADAAFVQLCQTQKSFRARLTPKPWRCGATQPPNLFPREADDDQQRFKKWLGEYEQACRRRATCQFLDHVGPHQTHDRVTPIVEVHDRFTRAFEPLQLA